jgi:hypothetical protein
MVGSVSPSQQQQQQHHPPRSPKRHLQQQRNGMTRNDDNHMNNNTTTITTNNRPYDRLGPPSDPIEFPRPQLLRGRRDTVVCYNPITDDHEILENVLFRDFGRNIGSNNNSSNNNSNSARSSRNNNNNTVTKAFWPIPFKAKIQTIMGHVEYVFFFFFLCDLFLICCCRK